MNLEKLLKDLEKVQDALHADDFSGAKTILYSVTTDVEISVETAKAENKFILKEFVLVPDFARSAEHIIILQSAQNGSDFFVGDQSPVRRIPNVVAVYMPTGRGPFRDEHGSAAWEYEYKGVRII